MQDSQIEIQQIDLLENGLDAPLREAFARHEASNPQFGADWLLNLASHALGADEKAVVYTARSAAGDIVALPLKLNARSGDAQSLGNFYTSAYTPLICSDSPVPLLEALLRHLASNAHVGMLTLSPLDVSPLLFDQIEAALEASGWKGAHRFFCFGNWIHELDGASYQSYLDGRSSQLKNTIGRRTRRFLAEDRGQLLLVQGGDQLESAIDQFTAVYSSSWKQEEPFPNFMPELLRLCARRGWLRLGIALYDKVAVASQAWLVSGNCAYIYKLAHREDFKHLSPGTVLTAYMMEQVIEHDPVSRIDFLSGDDSFKQDWMSSRRERHGIAAYNPGNLRGSSLAALHKVKSLAKKILPK